MKYIHKIIYQRTLSKKNNLKLKNCSSIYICRKNISYYHINNQANYIHRNNDKTYPMTSQLTLLTLNLIIVQNVWFNHSGKKKKQKDLHKWFKVENERIGYPTKGYVKASPCLAKDSRPVTAWWLPVPVGHGGESLAPWNAPQPASLPLCRLWCAALAWTVAAPGH